jgi:hypothetical protein
MAETLLTLALEEDKNLTIRDVESDSNDKYMDDPTLKNFGHKDPEKRFRESGFAS